MLENDVGTVVVETAIKIHRELGGGLLESVYEAVMAQQLRRRGLEVNHQVCIPIEYEGLRFRKGFRADLLVEAKVIIELKSVQAVNDTHKKQLLTYLKLSGIHLGYVLNFGESLMKRGIFRVVNRLAE